MWKKQPSPSTRREWIEMPWYSTGWIYIMSPSTRREWIEMLLWMYRTFAQPVSLHTEGVD